MPNERYLADREAQIARAKTRQARMIELGLCPCGRYEPRSGRRRCEKCAEQRRLEYINNRHKVLMQNKTVYYKRRWEVINHYGACCVCCGETYPPFLCIDHIYGGGHKHQQKVGRGTNYYKWIVDNQFPKDMFQVLCHNCNAAKGTKETCPCSELS